MPAPVRGFSARKFVVILQVPGTSVARGTRGLQNYPVSADQAIRSQTAGKSQMPEVMHVGLRSLALRARVSEPWAMDYLQLLRAEGGVSRSSRLIELGFSRYHQARLLRLGVIVRPAEGWVALPGLDEELLFATQHGVLITCMTLTKRLGLWNTRDCGLHTAVRSVGGDSHRSGDVTHWGRPVVRRKPYEVLDPIENALAYIADCQPREEAFAVWESALRKNLVTKSSMERLRLRPAARQILAECTPYSDSGLESMVAHRLRSLWLNVKQQIWMYGHRVDLLVEGWLVIQIDGGHHVGRQRDEDNMHDAVLDANGFVVIRLSYHQVIDDWPAAQHLIMTRLSQGRPGRR